MPANSRGTRLAAYDLWEASLGIRTGLKKFRFDISLHWKNLLNEDYQLIYGYPMPGRSWQIRMAVKRKM